MEPDRVDLEAAIQAVAILTAIPIAFFALWTDYFERNLHQLHIKSPKFDRNAEIEKVRTASLCVILFQFTLFIGSYEIRHSYPLSSMGIFCTGVLVQLWLQSKIEKKTMNTSSIKPDDLFGLIARATLAWLVGALFYIVAVLLSIRVSIWIAEASRASVDLGAVIFFLGGILGIISGVLINFALAPLHLKKVLPSQLIEDSALKTSLEKGFLQLGIKPPNLFTIELNQFHVAHIILTGFQWGKGSLGHALFIARPLLTSLASTELHALVSHQVSRIALKHTRKRFFLTFSLIILTTMISLASVIISKKFFPEQTAFEIVGPAFAIGSFFISFKILIEQIKTHQFEADVHSIEKLGVQMKDYIECLRKLDRPAPNSIILGNPETERRIELVQKHFDQLRDTDSLTSLKAG
jgi:Zn-dependent protease with chaperone function